MVRPERIKEGRAALGWSQPALADAAGVSVASIRKIERGAVARPTRLRDIASALGVAEAWLMGEVDDPRPTTANSLQVVAGEYLKVVGVVAAGVWRESLQFDDTEVRTFPVMPLPQFEGFQQFLLAVDGPSMDMHYPSGSLIHCIQLAFGPRVLPLMDGDHVIVQRQQGGLYETTCKELHGGKLWPRSTDPRYVKPIPVDEGGDVEVIALVVGNYGIRPNIIGR